MIAATYIVQLLTLLAMLYMGWNNQLSSETPFRWVIVVLIIVGAGVVRRAVRINRGQSADGFGDIY